MSEADLLQKINELFEYRNLPSIIMKGNDGKSDSTLYDKLVQLQVSIYELDEILESNWEVPMDKLELKWHDIHYDMIQLGVKPSKIDQYSSQIYKYQKHELSLRESRNILSLNLGYFYFYKSCDVKLLRRIIYDSYPILKKGESLGAWRTFDLITEINDDLEDVYEDLTTINGNRFLLSILEKGVEATYNEYKGYLMMLSTKVDKSKSMVNDMTRDVYGKTLDLLQVQIQSLDIDRMSTAKMNGLVIK